jgi:hypothetical protein
MTHKTSLTDVEYRKIQGLVGEHSFSLVLPKSFALNLKISKGDFVKVYQQENRIIIEKAYSYTMFS